MKTPKDMYWEGLKEALEKGPRKIVSKEGPMAVYALNRIELDGLFEDNHFVTQRQTWLKYISAWPKYGAVVPKDILTSTDNWSVIFSYIDKDHWNSLRAFADKNDYGYYPELPEGRSTA